jgi:catechol 2,3-dioxygenase-like lactoylglutathione lyase family enzyme
MSSTPRRAVTGAVTRVVTRREALLAIPGLAVAGRLLAQAAPAPIRVRGISSVALAVSDVARSLAFYQGLFGLPIQARHGSTVLLRLGNGPYFLALMPADAAGPRIDHWGLAVESFDANRTADMLTAHGLTRAGSGQGLSGGPMRFRVSTRGDTQEVHMGDADGLVTQLQAPGYCGGSGPLGDGCSAVEPAPRGAPLSLSALSHLTINVPDPEATNALYRRLFGFDIQAYQAASPLLGVGPGPDFLMFIAAGGGRGGAAPTSARVNHVSLALPGFSVAGVQAALESKGIRPRPEGGGTGPLLHWVSMRMPNRGGAEGGTPELYFSDPDGLSIQVQDPSYCGGGGYLGEICS